MELVGNSLFLHTGDLVKAGMSPGYLKKCLTIGGASWKSVQDPKDKRRRLIEFESLNQRYKDLIQSHLGIDPYNHFKNLQRTKHSSKKAQLSLFLHDHVQADAWETQEIRSSGISAQEAYDLARSSAWLKLLTEAKAKRYGFSNKETMLKTALKEIAKEDLKGLRIEGLSTLRRKMKAWKDKGWRCLVHGNKGNAHAAKLDDQMKLVLRQFYSDSRKFPVSRISEWFGDLCQVKGWPVVGRQRINSYLNQPEVQNQCTRYRHGIEAWNNKYSPIINRYAPSYANDLWIMDGTSYELYYVDEKGKTGRLTAFFILDGASWKVLGVGIGKSETAQIVHDALRMAMNLTGSLPQQILADNSSAIKAGSNMEWYKQISRIVTFAKVGNARSKPIEAWWAHYQREILKMYHFHSGGNVKAKRLDTHMNEEAMEAWIKANPGALPSEAQLRRIILKDLCDWNELATKGRRAPNEIYAEGSPRHRPITLDMKIDLLWKWRKRGSKFIPHKYTSEGLGIGVKENRVLFTVPPMPPYKLSLQEEDKLKEEAAAFWRKHTGDAFRVKYDPDDPRTIALYLEDKFIAFAGPKWISHQAAVDFQKGDRMRLNRILDVQDRVRSMIEEDHVRDRESAEDIMKGAIPASRLDKEALRRSEAAYKQLENLGYVPEAVPHKSETPLKPKKRVDYLYIPKEGEGMEEYL